MFIDMFRVFKNGRPAGTRAFFTYEEARSYARSRIRKHLGGIPRYMTTNPPIGDFGYAVKRVD
jgi:hypothetical protein